MQTERLGQGNMFKNSCIVKILCEYPGCNGPGGYFLEKNLSTLSDG